MSIRIGIYDFFARVIPGGFYILIATYVGHTFRFFQITSLELSLWQVVVLAVLAYIMGLIMDPLANKLWANFFISQNIPEHTLEYFEEKHHDLKVKFKSKDWGILLAFIRKENLDVAGDIERYNAMQIMLRNISFGFIILFVSTIILLTQNLSALNTAIGLLSLVFAILSLNQSNKFRKWFYISIFEFIVAWDLNPSELIKK